MAHNLADAEDRIMVVRVIDKVRAGREWKCEAEKAKDSGCICAKENGVMIGIGVEKRKQFGFEVFDLFVNGGEAAGAGIEGEQIGCIFGHSRNGGLGNGEATAEVNKHAGVHLGKLETTEIADDVHSDGKADMWLKKFNGEVSRIFHSIFDHLTSEKFGCG
jgi:hypothetical protein